MPEPGSAISLRNKTRKAGRAVLLALGKMGEFSPVKSLVFLFALKILFVPD